MNAKTVKLLKRQANNINVPCDSKTVYIPSIEELTAMKFDPKYISVRLLHIFAQIVKQYQQRR